MATINMHMKFEIEIPKQTYAPETMSSTDRGTDGRTDRRTDKVNPVYPPSNFVGRGYKDINKRNAKKWRHPLSLIVFGDTNFTPVYNDSKYLTNSIDWNRKHSDS